MRQLLLLERVLIGTLFITLVQGLCSAPEVSNGKIRVIAMDRDVPAGGRIREGAVATMICDAGFQANGPTEATCSRNNLAPAYGSCVAPAPAPVAQTTQAIECQLPTVENGYYVDFTSDAPLQSGNRFPEGQSVYANCNSGFATSSGNVRTCRADGSWSGNAPVCNVVQAAAPAPAPTRAVAAPVVVVRATASPRAPVYTAQYNRVFRLETAPAPGTYYQGGYFWQDPDANYRPVARDESTEMGK